MLITQFFQDYSILVGQHFKLVIWVWYLHLLAPEKEEYFFFNPIGQT